MLPVPSRRLFVRRVLMFLLALGAAASSRAAAQSTTVSGFMPGARDIVNLDFAATPLGEFPKGLRLLQGNLEVVDKDGMHMLRASTPSELVIQLPEVLPPKFTVEFDLIPKECCNPEDLMLEGVISGSRSGVSAQLTWHPGHLMVVGGNSQMFQMDMPAAIGAALPSALTKIAVSFDDETVKMYTNGRRLYTLTERKFVRGRVLRVSLGGQDDDKYAVYLARVRIADAATTMVASGAPPSSPTSSGATGGATSGPGAAAPAGTTGTVTAVPATTTGTITPMTAPVTAVPATTTGTITPATTQPTGTAGTAGATSTGTTVTPTGTRSTVQPVTQPAPSTTNGNLLVGTGISDITGPIAEVGMMGYGKSDQKTAGLHMRQYARAFIFASPTSGRRVVFVSAELAMLFSSVKQGVLKKLAAAYGTTYDDRNVMLSATHTHAGPGGYSHHITYNLTTMGHVRQNYDAIVDGITEAIKQAHGRLAPATVGWLDGIVTDPATINRSKVAFDSNPEARAGAADPRETRMTVLSVRRNGQPAGAISWFAVHNTSLTQNNLLVSSDHKGYAAYLLEKTYGNIAPLRLTNEFVGAFPNGAEGDQSPNIAPGFKGPSPNGDEFESNRIIGDIEFKAANGLFSANQNPVLGDVDFRHTFVLMPGYVVGATSYVNGMGLKTLCQAAYGVSFMAGAEDGPTDMRNSGTVNEGSRLGDAPGEMSASELAALKATVVATIGALLAPITLLAPPLIPLVTGIMAALSGAMAVSSDPCQLPKPILLPTGALGWTPATLPFQILRIGPLAIVGVPGEMTVQAGRRLENAVRIRLGPAGVQKVILTGLANEYSGYITTPEEYLSQQYEGASTLFGRLTFDAYSEIFVQLADAMVSGQSPRLTSPPPPDLSLVPQLELQTGVVLDVAPAGIPFGTVTLPPRLTPYNRGEQVQVAFQGAHPKNDLRRNDTYFRIERDVPGGSPELVAWDAVPETKLMWIREGLAESKIVVFWTIPSNAQPGTYRIHHFGKYKDFDGLHDYSGSTTPFTIR